MNVYHKTIEQKINALIGDEAKQSEMLRSMAATIKQLQAKNSFRLALLNQIREELSESLNTQGTAHNQ